VNRSQGAGAWRGLSIAVAVALLTLAARVYLSRFDRLFEDHTVLRA
jgi:predicted alternative tryptophan synthase beta-subunit